jgi:hypothetical protein
MALALALLASAAFAQASDPSEARDGDFGAKLLVTDDPESFWAQWAQPGTPQLSTTSRIARGQVVEAVIVFYHCKPAVDGNCNIMVHYEMVRPDGRPYQKPLDAIAWHHPPAGGANLMASEAGLGFKLDPPDKLGTYIISATLIDTVSGKSLRLKQTITAVDEVPSARPAT